MIDKVIVEHTVNNLTSKRILEGVFSTKEAVAIVELLDNEEPSSNNFEGLKKELEADDPSKPGSYAHSWHCNVAMMCFDAIKAETPRLDTEVAHKIGNDAATRFMKLCFNVDTKA